MASAYFIVHISLAHPQFAKDGEEKRVVLTAAAWLDVLNQRCGVIGTNLYDVHIGWGGYHAKADFRFSK